MSTNEAKTGPLSATTVSATGAVSAASVSATGAISAASGNITGTLNAVDLTITGNFDAPFRKVRAVVTANVGTLSSFNVSTNTDGVTLTANDIVLLVAQSTAAQNGPYVVGTVAAGVAPLTRPSWFAAAATIKSGYTLQVGGEGSVFKNTTWKAMVSSDSFVVDTTDGKFYPLMVSGSTALSSGAATITTVPIFSGNSNVLMTRTSASGTTSTVEYSLNGSPTAGTIGTASVTIRAATSGGSTNTSDTSTITWTIFNQG